jgi:hypothetical protein
VNQQGSSGRTGHNTATLVGETALHRGHAGAGGAKKQGETIGKLDGSDTAGLE